MVKKVRKDMTKVLKPGKTFSGKKDQPRKDPFKIEAGYVLAMTFLLTSNAEKN